MQDSFFEFADEQVLISNEGEHGCCDLQPNYVSCIGNSTSLDLFTSMHHFIICVVSLQSFICSLLCFTKQEESNPKQENYFSYSQNEENSKMEDRLHIHRIWAKQ
jgi:hypothetical protein